MAVNYYFNNFTNSGEQNLIEDLIIESIRMYGHDIWYIPRTLGSVDNLLNEDDLPEFNSAYMVEMYIKNVDGFEGEGDFLSKFGLQIRDSITFTIAMRKFTSEVGAYNEEVRANEGDLIYFPLNKKMWEIKHVEHESIFYQMGALQTYDLKCDLFEFSNERMNTGVVEIDSMFDQYRTTGVDADTAIVDIESIPLVGADNEEIQRVATAILDFSESNPFGDDTY